MKIESDARTAGPARELFKSLRDVTSELVELMDTRRRLIAALDALGLKPEDDPAREVEGEDDDEAADAVFRVVLAAGAKPKKGKFRPHVTVPKPAKPEISLAILDALKASSKALSASELAAFVKSRVGEDAFRRTSFFMALNRMREDERIVAEGEQGARRYRLPASAPKERSTTTQGGAPTRSS